MCSGCIVVRKKAALVAIAAPLVVFSLNVLAQQAPNAGSLLNQIDRPAVVPESKATVVRPELVQETEVNAQSGPSITVKEIRFTGLRALPEAELQAVVAGSVGQTLTLGQLRVLAQKVTRHMRDRGLMLARVYLPQQDVTEGVVTFGVLEGALGNIKLSNKSIVDDKYVLRYLDMLPKDYALNEEQLDRSLMLIAEMGGASAARAVLVPGEKVGYTDAKVEVQPGPKVSGTVDVDNLGGVSTGEYRQGLNMRLGNVLGVGDVGTVRALVSEDFQSARFGSTYIGGNWLFPVHGTNWHLGVNAGALTYRLGQDYTSLNAYGESSNYGAQVRYALVRRQQKTLTLALAFDHKNFRDVQLDSDTSKHSDSVSFSLSGQILNGLGERSKTGFVVGYTAGNLSLSDAATVSDASATGNNTRGSYGKLFFAGSHLHGFNETWSLNWALAGQQGSKNLDSSERFTLGGPFAVRAYSVEEWSANDAWVTSLELRYTVPQVAGLVGLAFYEYGKGTYLHSAAAGVSNPTKDLSGIGFGTQWTINPLWYLSTVVAWHTGIEPTTGADRNPRALLQLSRSF